MNQRQKQILKILIYEDDYMTVQQIADQVNVSLRTTHNDLKEITNLLEIHKLRMEKKPNVGVRIDAKPSVKKSLLNYVDESKEEVNILSTKIRRMKITSRLLSNKNGTSLNKLADEFMVSKTSIVSDFEKITTYLNDFNIHLERDHFGTRAIGDEKDIRHALSQLANNFVQLEFEEELSEKTTSRLDLPTLYRLRNIFEIDDIGKIEEIIAEAQKRLGYMINEMSYVNLLTHLLILIKRLKSVSTYGVEDADKIFTLDTIEKSMAISHFIASAISKDFQVEVPSGEIKYIHQYLVCSGIQSSFMYLDADNYSLELDDEYMGLINQLITIISDSVHYDLTVDKELKLSLMTHFIPLVQRIKYNTRIENPLVSEIKTQYSAMFSIVSMAVQMIESSFLHQLNDDEIGFLTIHFQAAIERSMEQKRVVIVCPEGIGFSRLIAHRVERFISSVRIVDIVSINKLNTMDLSNIDFVISTVPIKHCEKKVVLVSSFISEMDIRDVNNFLVESAQNGEHHSLEHLSKIIDETVVFSNLAFKSKDEVLSFLSQQMNKAGYVTKKYEKTLFEREKIMSTELGNYIAIPHGSEQEIIESRVAIATLKEPITWNKHEIRVVFLLALTMDNPQKTKNILKDLYSIIDSKSMIKLIMDARNDESIIQVIRAHSFE